MATTMEATWYNTIWTWLCDCYNRAYTYAKWIWDAVKSFFSSLYEATFTICEKVGICGQYKRQRSWKKSDGENGYEIGHDELEFRVGVNSDAVPDQGSFFSSDPEESKKKMDEMEDSIKEGKEIFQKGLNVFNKLEETMKEHKQHNNQQRTEEKLKEVMQDQDTKKVRDLLEKQPMVNKTLA